MRYLLTIGERLNIFPPKELPFKFINNYGPTETTVISTTTGLLTPIGTSPMIFPTIGRPIANTQLYILDEQMQLVPIGAKGELYIGGYGVAEGYFNHQELTKERFVENPYKDGDRIYRTGDLARYWTDGQVEFLGRNDKQVKVRGFRIELGEIEILLRNHPEIKESIVTTWVNDRQENNLVAYVVLKKQKEFNMATKESILNSLKLKLTDYMIPSLIISLNQIPVTVNGKVDYNGLPSALEASKVRTNPYLSPRNHTEEELANIWAEVLEV